jgi:hypothetical protein
MTGGKRLGIVDGDLAQEWVVSIGANQALSRAFIECQAALGLRSESRHGFVDVFDGLDEVGLSDDDVGFWWDFNRYGQQINHVHLR